VAQINSNTLTHRQSRKTSNYQLYQQIFTFYSKFIFSIIDQILDLKHLYKFNSTSSYQETDYYQLQLYYYNIMSCLTETMFSSFTIKFNKDISSETQQLIRIPSSYLTQFLFSSFIFKKI